MHTAICTFEKPSDADRAVERLVEAGFDRGDIHMEHRHADGTPLQARKVRPVDDGDTRLLHGEPTAPGQANDSWDFLEREVAMDASHLHRLGNFFGRLFGLDDGPGSQYAASYAKAVDRGLCVVIVDAHSDAEGERAQQILHGMEAGDMSLFQRVDRRPLRELIAEREFASGGRTSDSAARPGPVEQGFGTARADMGPSHNSDVRGEGEFPRERAVASHGWGEQSRLDVVDHDQQIGSPDLKRGDTDDKPR